MSRATLLTVALVVGVAALPGRALALERVTLKNGRTVVGTIEARDEQGIQFVTEFGQVAIRHDQIEKIENVSDAPAARSPAAEAARVAGATTKPTVLPSAAAPAAAPDGAAPNVPATAAQKDLAAKRAMLDARPPTAQEAEALAGRLVPLLAAKEATVRVAAIEEIVGLWPHTSSVVDAALASADPLVRREAVWLLDRAELGDTDARVVACLGDANPAVRTAAIRIVRHRRITSVEADLVRMLQHDAQWSVRQEAIRTLEEVGTPRCLRPVLDAWTHETDPDRKRRFMRVLRRLTAVDHGDDVEAWRRTVDALAAPSPRSN